MIKDLWWAVENGDVDSLNLLLTNGDMDVNKKYMGGETALFRAVYSDRVNCVNLLLESRAIVDLANEKKWTPLKVAAEKNHVHCLTLLLKAGANVNLVDQDGWAPLINAANKGHVDCVKWLLEGGANVNITSNDGWTPLRVATTRGHVDCAKYLLERGANINLATRDGWTPLKLAVDKGHLNCVKLLLNSGANVDLAGQDGWTPLNVASYKGHVDCVKLLLENGANIDAVDKDGWTPLNRATDEGHVDCVKSLLECGANVDLPNKEGWTPLNRAADEGHDDCVKLLLQGEANTDLPNKGDWTPLNSAANKGHAKCVCLLLEGGADVAFANQDGWAPLNSAANKGHENCVKLLLNGCANMNAANKDGWTPLNAATFNDHASCVELLLSVGANLDLANKNEHTPFATAWSKSHTNCVVKLIAYGAKVNYRRSLVDSNPHASIDKEGRTALHVAVDRNRPKKDILNIIQAYPMATDVRDNNGMTPIDIGIRCGSDVSVLALLLQSWNAVTDKEGDYSLLHLSLQLTRKSIQASHVHLIGHGYAGKTTCRLAFIQTLKYLNPIKFRLFGSLKDVYVDRSNGSGTTEGMEMVPIESPHHKWLIRDYGGQEDFHVNHARFLLVPGSIYVIIVALWDEENGRQFDLGEVKTRLLYWLKFLNSISAEGSSLQSVVVINFYDKVVAQHATECLEAIKTCCATWNFDNSSVRVHGEPCVVSVKSVVEVRQLNAILQYIANDSQETFFPVFAYINAIDVAFDTHIGTLGGKLARRSKFIKTVCIPAIMIVLSVVELPTPHQHFDLVCDKMIEYLCASGKIIIVPTSSSPDDPLIVLNVNWLSKELLGSLINTLAQTGREEFILTAMEIDKYTNGGSHFFGDLEGLVSFLESIGACVCVNDNSTSNEIKRWFPLCGQRKFVSGKECVPMEKGVWTTFRKVVRLFKLSDPAHQMFPPGYFLDLFLKILNSFSFESTKKVKVFINGLDVMYQFADSRLQVLLVVLDDNGSFTLEVSYASRIVSPSGREECWKRFRQIFEVIWNPNEVYAAKDIIRVSPWFDNVKLTELFVDPCSDALTKAQEALKTYSSIKVTEIRDTKTLADLERKVIAIQNLYIYGCDETDMPVDEKDPPPHILEVIFRKVDSVRQQLKERWNTVTVTVSSDLIQESFQVMLNSLKDSMSSELQSMVESSKKAICGDSLNINLLQNVVEQLRSDVGEKITSGNVGVLTELNRVQKSMKEVTDEVYKIQHLNDKTLQSAILKSLEESKKLQIFDNLLRTLVKNTHHVPTMVIVIPVVKKASMLSSFNPSDWTSNEYSLYFVCSHSHQVVPCGPDGKGYRFRQPKEWFKKVAPVIKVCMIAVKIALTISGIPLPINGIVQSLDEVTAVTESQMYLNTAMNVVDAACDVSSTLGIVVDDQDSVVSIPLMDNAEQYVKFLDAMLKQSDTIEAYKSLKALLDEVDPTLGSVGVEKVTSESGKTEWVKKGDQEVIESFKGDKKWPLKIDRLKESYKVTVATNTEDQSRLGTSSGLWLPKSWFKKKI